MTGVTAVDINGRDTATDNADAAAISEQYSSSALIMESPRFFVKGGKS